MQWIGMWYRGVVDLESHTSLLPFGSLQLSTSKKGVWILVDESYGRQYVIQGDE